MEKKGITLIGMPTSGKTTIGREIAQRLRWPLLDIDQCIEKQEGMALGEVITNKGSEYALNLETEFIHGTNLLNTVVSTPGSIIYNDVLGKLQSETRIYWLDVTLDEVKRRLSEDPNPRRLETIIGAKEKGLDLLYAERTPLYRKWAQFVISCAGKDVTQIASEVISLSKINK
jgi:shikimate kinase